MKEGGSERGKAFGDLDLELEVELDLEIDLLGIDEEEVASSMISDDGP